MSLYDVLEISDDLKPFVNDYKINLIDVPRLTGEQVEKFTSDFQIIADYFVQLNESKNYVPKDKTIRHTDSFLKLMSVITQDNKYVEIGSELFQEREEVNMCEVLDKVEARGKAIGALNNTVEILRVIIAKNRWSKEQAMEFIGIPKSEFAKYAALL